MRILIEFEDENGLVSTLEKRTELKNCETCFTKKAMEDFLNDHFNPCEVDNDEDDEIDTEELISFISEIKDIKDNIVEEVLDGIVEYTELQHEE
jgi:hypothetical protein